MKQIIQNYRTGKLEVAEVSVPVCSSNTLLVKNAASLISIGTERSIIDLGKKSLLGKARARPDFVKRFMDKAKNEGFVKTFKEALGRLDNLTALGYRSIVVDPRRAEMKDVLNARIKRREPFRPFAPSILLERVGEYFEKDYPDPFMIKVYPIKPEKRAEIPVVTHVD